MKREAYEFILKTVQDQGDWIFLIRHCKYKLAEMDKKKAMTDKELHEWLSSPLGNKEDWIGEGWKPLEVDNLPPDILMGDYEFELFGSDPYCGVDGGWVESTADSNLRVLIYAVDGKEKYRYRKIPKKKTVEEMAEEYAEEWRRKQPSIFRDAFIASITSAYVAGYKEASK